MRERRRPWRIRLAFEPNRFAAKHLVKVYEQLKPMEPHSPSAQSSLKLARTKHSATKRGGQ